MVPTLQCDSFIEGETMTASNDALTSVPLEEKVQLLIGTGWGTNESKTLGLRPITMADGPHGLRKSQEGSLGLGGEVPATCFPPSVTLGATWDTDLAYQMGAAIGRESHQENVDVLLGPGINLKRSPLCGRNFEYLSEDPLLSGVLGAAYINGIQSNNVAACVKHYAANNQETRRMNVDAVIDERTLNELYLRSFEILIELSNPWTLMCSYNSVNGSFASESKFLLTDVLRDRWNYDGVVVSDWTAVIDRARSLEAGLDIEMPTSKNGAPRVIEAVRNGELSEDLVDLSVNRLITLAQRVTRPAPSEPVDFDAHHALARRIAAAGVVMLKNEGNILPLADKAGQKIVVIGEFAQSPRAQGQGSSRVNALRNDDALTALKARFVNSEIEYSVGVRSVDSSDEAAIRAEAVEVAKNSDVAVLFIGLSDLDESEGFDRTDIAIPNAQIALVREVAKVNKNVVVVLTNGSLVDIASWMDEAPAILEAWLGGQAGGPAICDILSGDASPSGRLSESIPFKLSDIPAQMNFPGEFDSVIYGERLNVGYRYFTSFDVPVAFPFGFGLSYTNFEYKTLSVTEQGDNVVVRVGVTNTGSVDGAEVVQVYVGREESVVDRPVYELKGFARTFIKAGATEEVTVTIPTKHLAYWDVRVGRWVVEPGSYTFNVGASSGDIRLRSELSLAGDNVTPPLTAMSTLGEWLESPTYGEKVREVFGLTGEAMAFVGEEGSPNYKMFMNIRLNQIVHLANSDRSADEMVAEVLK